MGSETNPCWADHDNQGSYDMPFPLRVPRINNNDDFVKVIRLIAREGDHIKRGDVLAEIETDKSVANVEAERDAFLLKTLCVEDEQVAVGSVMMWLGDSATEPVPESTAAGAGPTRRNAAEPTAKARELLGKYHLSLEEVPASGDRLSAADVEAYWACRGSQAGAEFSPAKIQESLPLVAGDLRPLTVEERGMVHTVTWYRDQAAATYLEIEYDPKPWEDYAAAYAAEHRLMMSPFLPLLAYRLVELVRRTPKTNATLVNGAIYQYRQVNLGFTVQVGETLYLTVVQHADDLEEAGFISKLGELQRRAMSRSLGPEESQGATVTLTSMSRWNVSRHVPIMPPYTSMIVAHSAPRHSGMSVLGATYDHRVLSGFDVVRLLQLMSHP
jgi:pyruvate dehydrogenase E2 component (dihydrolipoamide acetyltransferase)